MAPPSLFLFLLNKKHLSPVGWLAGGLGGWVGWVGWLAGWLAGCLVGWLASKGQ